MRVYLIITADKYELPLAVRDNVGEIADLLGKLKYDVYASISRKQVSQKKYNGFHYKIIQVEIDEEDDDGESREGSDHSQTLCQG